MNALRPEIVNCQIPFLLHGIAAWGYAIMISKTVPEKYQQRGDQPIGSGA